MTNSNKNITIGTILGYFLFFINILSGLLITPLIIRHLGQSMHGVYSLSHSIVTLFLLDFGLTATANTFLSKLRAKNDRDGINRFSSSIIKIYLFLDFFIVLIFAFIFFFIDFLYSGLSTNELHYLKITFVITAATNILTFPCTTFSGILSSHERFIANKIIDIIYKIFYIVVTIVVIKLNLSIVWLVLVNCLCSLLSFLLRFIYIKVILKIKINPFAKLDKTLIKQIVIFSIWSGIISIFSRLAFSLTPSILGMVSNSTAISVFGVVSVIEGYIYSFGTIMSGFFMPKIAKMFEDKENFKNKFYELSTKIGKLQFLLIGLVFGGFLCCGKYFLTLWLSNDTTYSIAYFEIILIVLTQLIIIPEVIFYTAIFVVEKLKYMAFIALIKMILCLGLSFPLSHMYGSIGAAIAIFVSRVFEMIASNILYSKIFKINIWKFLSDCILKGIFILFIVSIITIRTTKLINLSSQLLNFLLSGSFFVVLYVIANILFNINQEERSLFKRLLKKNS